MAPLNEEYMNGFADLMSEHLKAVQRDGSLKGKEEKLAADINLGLQVCHYSQSSGSTPSTSDVLGTSSPGKKGLKGSQEQKKKGQLPRPDAGMIYLSAVNSKAIFSKVIEDLDPHAIGLRVIPGTAIRYFTMLKSSDSTSPKIIFFAPGIDNYEPLALGKSLAAQRLELHNKSIEVKEKIKEYMLENQEKNAQIICTGQASGAIVAQLAAMRLMYDIDLQLYKNRHRVISIVFGDVRIFSPSFISSIDAYAFDHQDHLSFCSTEAYLPMNVALHGKVNYVGKRIEFDLKSLVEKQPTSKIDLNSAIIVQHPLLKFLTWDTFKLHSLPAFEAYEVGRSEDKALQVPKAIETLQKHFKQYRLASFPDIFVDCVHDKHGDVREGTIPSSRLICTVKDTNTKAEIQFYFHVYWADDVHDINEKFLSALSAARKEAYNYVQPKIKEEKKEAGLKPRKQQAGYRYQFVNWVKFFQSQLSDSITPQEAASRLINPFFDESCYFELDNAKFKYGLSLSSEVMIAKLLSTDESDQKLIKILFGPIDAKLMYRDLVHATHLFHAPASTLSAARTSPLNLIVSMFSTQVPRPLVSEFIHMDKEKLWGDFKLTKVQSMHMEKFSSDVPLQALIETLPKPNKSKNCSYSLPAKHCPKMTLLEIQSPFWSRVYRIGDIYVAYRGSTIGSSTQSEVNAFCDSLRGRDYDKIGSSIVLEIQSQKASYGPYLPQYTFYMMIIQDPRK